MSINYVCFFTTEKCDIDADFIEMLQILQRWQKLKRIFAYECRNNKSAEKNLFKKNVIFSHIAVNIYIYIDTLQRA